MALPLLYALRAMLPVLVTIGFVGGLLMLAIGGGAIDPMQMLQDLLRSLIGL
ncbi:hypothetical protein [Natrarchaeobius chitinivorans]|uniref:hypothetical protein n=1 Tax=Natrarchaeobius chitinivorans TaxID=1679083 RepID=UPI001404EEB3|nr:hypothetical protein [Natrarchaeobius chitinivorans]